MRFIRYLMTIRDFLITVIGAVFFVLYVMIYGGLVLLVGKVLRKK
ncbi:MAG TPA: 1-acyl-sn-glycerol-3-phosphate acyltransferase, partial [Kosmotogaceae bacterium]|nr:1-acyl-sn-glycerol-3-phosphate acyltransferase [Kosmotogaceae bacterium]